MLKRSLSILISIIVMASALCMPFYSFAKSYEQELKDKGFPESYISSLVSLHNKYPKWNFEPFKTGLSWEEAVLGERSSHSKQLVQKSSSKGDAYYCSCSKCKKNGSYVIQEGSSWVSASEQAVKYYMDPRNWLSEKYIFQFESTSYDSSQSKSGVESIVSSTWMKDAYITYNSTSGSSATYKDSDGNKVKYSAAILDAAKNSGMSAYYLASKIVQEVGSTKATTGGSCGTRAPFIGIYNYYNIGAYSGAMEGLEWASGYLRAEKETTLYSSYNSEKKKGSGTKTTVAEKQYMSYISKSGDYYKVKLYNEKAGNYSTDGKTGYVLKSDLRTTYFNYGRPWTNPYKTIYYGAEYIAKSFSKYQNTGYLQKFNVNKASNELYNHEYMANADGASSEAAITYKAYSNANILSSAKTFYIPVYNSMPSSKCTMSSSGSSSSTSTTDSSTNKVKGLTLESRTKTSLTFNWNKFSGATKYYLYIKNVTKGTNFNKTVTTNSATLNGLTPANEYSVKVKAYTSKGWSEYSSYNTKHALPDKTEGLKVKSKSASSITLQWSKKDGADGYYVYQYNPGDKKYTKVKTVKSGSTVTAKISSLKSATKYYYAVSAYTVDSKTKEGTKSGKISAQTKPAKVTLKSVSSPSATKIKAAWSKAGGGETGYQIYYSKDKKFSNLTAKKLVESKKTTSYTGKNFTKGKTYYVKVRAYKTVDGKKQYGSWSAVKSIKCK